MTTIKREFLIIFSSFDDSVQRDAGRWPALRRLQASLRTD